MSLISCNNDDHRTIEGYVEGNNLYMAAPFYGILEQLPVQSGQYVEKGDLLFVLDPNPQQIAIAQYINDLKQAQNTLLDLQKPRRPPEIQAIEAQIEQANATITLAEIRVARYQKLFDKQASDKDTLDAALTNLQQQKDLKSQLEANLALAKLGSREDQIKAQQNQVDSLTEKLKQAQWELAQKTVVAPTRGIIFDTYYSLGEFVIAQQPVVSLLTAENIEIIFFVPLNSLGKLKLNQKLRVSCDGCEKESTAVITYISPNAEYLPPLIYSRDNNANLVFRIKAIPDNPLVLKPGQPVMVTF